MPKLLVLFHTSSPALVRLAEAIAEGARSVRFAEVDLRHLDGAETVVAGTTRLHALESESELAAYDGLIIGASSNDGDEPSALASMLRASAVRLDNKVGSVFSIATTGHVRGPTIWSILHPMGDRGMILVPPRDADVGEDELDSARRQGKRIADIVGWITHARSHHHHH
jgi:hypothetical protein